MTNKDRSVVTPQERGLRGYLSTYERYGKPQMDRWRRKGGRKPNRTLGQILAGIAPSSRARFTSRREGRPSTTTRFE